MPSKPINNKNKIGKNKIEIKREKYTTKLLILNLQSWENPKEMNCHVTYLGFVATSKQTMHRGFFNIVFFPSLKTL